MSTGLVPVTMGSPRSITRQTECVRVVEVWFPPGAVLDSHTHDRAIFSIMLRGGFQTEIATRWLECDAGCAWTEPNAEKHANYVGREGAHVLVIQPDHACEEFVEPVRRLLDEVHLLKHPALLCAAPRILAELRSPDLTSALSIETDVAAALATAARVHHRDGTNNGELGWLRRVRELLHEEWRTAPSLSYVARVAGVHPCHLAHTFRERLGETVGTYVQRLRVAWAIGEVTTSERPISQIALEAGFCDQSHFTRQCLRFACVTPAAYRARVAGGTRVRLRRSQIPPS
jgi:AraC family transcriptional regulator